MTVVEVSYTATEGNELIGYVQEHEVDVCQLQCDSIFFLHQYNRLTYDYPAINTVLVGDLPRQGQFDVALSLSR